MPSRLLINRFGLIAALLTALSLLVALVPALWAVFLLNWGRIDSIQGNMQNALVKFSAAYHIDSSNPFIVKRLAEALLRKGDLQQATQVGAPLLDDCSQGDVDARFSISLLLYAGREDEAINLYTCLHVPPPLTPGSAARLMNAMLNQDILPPPAIQAGLLGEAIGIRARWQPKFQTLAEHFSQEDFWQNDFGQRVRESLAWRSQLRPDLPTTQNPPAWRAVAPSTIDGVADRFDIMPEPLELGTDLVVNGRFEEYDWLADEPEGWAPTYMAFDHTWGEGVFVAGVEQDAESRVLRIDGLFHGSQTGRSAAFAGFWHDPIPIAPASKFLVSFRYKTENMTASNVSLWLSGDPDISLKDDFYLPPTGGLWESVSLIVWNLGERATLAQPLLRLSGEGTVWFDDFSLRTVAEDTDADQSHLKAISDETN